MYKCIEKETDCTTNLIGLWLNVFRMSVTVIILQKSKELLIPEIRYILKAYTYSDYFLLLSEAKSYPLVSKIRIISNPFYSNFFKKELLFGNNFKFTERYKKKYRTSNTCIYLWPRSATVNTASPFFYHLSAPTLSVCVYTVFLKELKVLNTFMVLHP